VAFKGALSFCSGKVGECRVWVFLVNFLIVHFLSVVSTLLKIALSEIFFITLIFE
jgi:hypothetical protein